MRWMLVVFAVVLAGCAGETKSERVSRTGVWAVNQNDEMCFAFTLTFADDNRTREEVDARFYITSYRDSTRREEPSIRLTEPVPVGSAMYVDIGDRRVALFTDGERRLLWVDRPYDEKALLELMLNAEYFSIHVRSPGRDPVRLSFYTLGLGEALATLRETCLA